MTGPMDVDDEVFVFEFEKTFQKVLADNKFNLIIDLKEVNYISSAGWGIFVGEIRRIRSQKGNLFLVGMSPEVTEAYELLEFETILKSFPNVELAVQKGFGKSSIIKPMTIYLTYAPSRAMTADSLQLKLLHLLVGQ